MKNIDAVLISHEHSDHIHTGSLADILAQNPSCKVYTNSATGKLLDEAKIPYENLDGKSSLEIKGVKVDIFHIPHAWIYEGIPQVPTLALPVAGPWLKIEESVDYAKAVKPDLAFPVHDGMLKHVGPFHFLPGKLLEEVGIKFTPLVAGQILEIN